jgi:hypothetical protein
MGALALGQGAGLASVQSLLDSGLATLHLLRQDLPHFIGPRAGLKVRRMNPSLIWRVDTSHSATAAYSSISFATVAPDSGVRPSDASLSSLPSADSLLTWEPVSGIEPLTCRLQEVRPQAPSALAAPMARVIALTTPTALGLSDGTFHEPFHAFGGNWPMAVTERSDRNPPQRRRIGHCIAESSLSLDQEAPGPALPAPSPTTAGN